jgi:two-component system sensor histidine kinase RegB
LLRWIAVFGQILTIIIAKLLFGLQLPMGGFAIAIGAPIILNVLALLMYPENTRLTERGATLMLLFDITQLSAMLYLSGGLNNPFALLILVPVTISASALRPLPAVITGASAICFMTLAAVFSVPLRDHFGNVMLLPDIFVFGSWAGIVIGIIFLGVFSWRLTSEAHNMSTALLATQMALGREQKLTDLGGVVAAAAHELGTPLATIKLVSSELIDDLKEHKTLLVEAQLINEQADRCRDILRSMGRSGKDDLLMRVAPLQAVVEEAAEPHMARGKMVLIEMQDEQESGEQPFVYRQPEIIHGLRNLVQNAVDFAQSKVWVRFSWTDSHITVRIVDDGMGFPASIIGKIGDPFVRRRRQNSDAQKRPGYEGMGLGLFIAKTLLERTGADISFSNGHEAGTEHSVLGEPSGAIVVLRWDRDRISADEGTRTQALGENQHFAQ